MKNVLIYLATAIFSMYGLLPVTSVPLNQVEPLFGASTTTYQRSLFPETTNFYELGTTTKQWLRMTTKEVCVSGDCKTAWPAGGGSGGNGFFSATSSFVRQVTVTNGTTTSTLAANSLNIATSTGNLSGLFSVDASGNVSASGTMQVFSTTTVAKRVVLSSDGTNAIVTNVEGNLNLKNNLTLDYLSIGAGGVAPGGFTVFTNGHFAGVDGNTATFLDFFWNVADSSTARAYTFDTKNVLSTAGARLLSVKNSGVEKFYVDYSGGVSASGSLQITGTTTLYSSSTVATPLSVLDSSGALIFSAASSSIVALQDSLTPITLQDYEVMTLGNSTRGGVLNIVGGTISTLPGIVLTVGGQVRAEIISNGNIISSPNGTVTNTFSSTEIKFREQSGSNSGLFNVDANGDISASGTFLKMQGLAAPTATADVVCYLDATGLFSQQPTNCTVSSAFFKEHIASLSIAELLQKVMSLNVVSYNLKENGRYEMGLIAEEVARIEPSLVVYTDSYSAEQLAFVQKNYPDVILFRDGKTLLPRTIDYARLSILNIAANQAQQSQIAELQESVLRLESKVGFLELFTRKLKDLINSLF